MKTLFLIRHAKSSRKEKELNDLDRPLNGRGKRDAPFMAKLLHKQKISPGLIITSPAKRALKTATTFAAEMNYRLENITVEKNIYLASVNELLEVLHNVSDETSTVMLFGHNPGLTDLLNLLSEKGLDNIPTCGIAELELKNETWNNLGAKDCILRSFEYPGKYF